MSNKIILFTNQTTNASSAKFYASNRISSTVTEKTFLTVFGVFDGASIGVEYQADDNNWYITGDKVILTPCAYYTQLNSLIPFRLTLTNAGALTNINAIAYQAN